MYARYVHCGRGGGEGLKLKVDQMKLRGTPILRICRKIVAAHILLRFTLNECMQKWGRWDYIWEFAGEKSSEWMLQQST
jgi:hypothetical protein